MRTEIETSDIFKASYLLCSGGRLEATRQIAKKKVVFVIAGEGLHEKDMLFRTGQALVNPLQLRESLNLLRDLLFEKLRNPNREKENYGHGMPPKATTFRSNA